VANGLFGGEVGAGPVCVGSLAGEPDWQDQPVPVTGPQVPAEQLGHPVHPRPGDVGHEAGRLAEGKLDESGRHLSGVDRHGYPAR
jgi:hypothetical protein